MVRKSNTDQFSRTIVYNWFDSKVPFLEKKSGSNWTISAEFGNRFQISDHEPDRTGPKRLGQKSGPWVGTNNFQPESRTADGPKTCGQKF